MPKISPTLSPYPFSNNTLVRWEIIRTAYQDGTQYLLFSPEELLEKLAALVPIPRVHLTRFHGCLAPNSKIRGKVILKTEEKKQQGAAQKSDPSRRRRLSWAQLMKPVFKIDLEDCARCGGKVTGLCVLYEAWGSGVPCPNIPNELIDPRGHLQLTPRLQPHPQIQQSLEKHLWFGLLGKRRQFGEDRGWDFLSRLSVVF